MDQRTRKLMSIHKSLHPRDDIDRLYVPRKEGRRGLASTEDKVHASIKWFEDYTEKCGGRLPSNRNKTDDTRINRTEITRK